MATRKKKSALAIEPPDPKEKKLSPAQIAARLTWQLKGDLKNAQIAYLRVAVKLARIRDERMYVALKHKDMVSYGFAALKLGRASVYRYLRVYDWVLKEHKEWLEPHPKGYIPDLSDAIDAISIEKELAKKDLQSKKRAALEGLHKKALAGDLKDDDLKSFKRQSRSQKSDLDGLIARQRTLRNQTAKDAELTDAVAFMDSAIKVLENHRVLSTAGLIRTVTLT